MQENYLWPGLAVARWSWSA